MEFAITAGPAQKRPVPADDSYQSPLEDFIHAGLPVGLARSRCGRMRSLYAEPLRRQNPFAKLSLWNAFYQRKRQLAAGLVHDLEHRTRLARPRWRLALAIGFCGSYTTFSSYAFESFAYFEQGHYLLFAGNVLTNNVLCLLAILAGAALARTM